MKSFYKTLLLLFLIPIASITLLSFKSFSQTPLVKQWDYTYGGSRSDIAKHFIHTSDGGMLLAGYSFSDSSGEKSMPNWDTSLTTSDFWIVKLDYAGNKEWDKRFGGTGDDLLMTVQQTADGGYIVGGPSISEMSGDKTQDNCDGYNFDPDYWVVKMDSLGNKQWDKRYGGREGDVMRGVSLSVDNGYLLAGYSSSYAHCEKTLPSLNYTADYWIVKTDSFGNKLWDKIKGGYMGDFLFSTLATDDGGYLLGGESYSDSNGVKSRNNLDPTLITPDYWIIKIDSLGVKQWDKSFGGINTDRFRVMRQTPDKGFIIGGITNSDSSGDVSQHSRGWWDYWIVKTDSLGNKQWDRRFGGTNSEDEFDDIVISSSGHYMLCGTSYSDSSGDKTEDNMGGEQMWIVMIDSAGNKIWDKTIFTDSLTGHEEGAWGIFMNHDSCYVFATISFATIGGYKSQPSRGQHDYWIIKFCDSTATNGISPAVNYPQPAITISPNPSDDIFQITFPKDHRPNYTLEIINTLGQTVFKQYQTSNYKHQTTIDVSFLPKGIYVLKIYDGASTLSNRLVIE